MLTRRSFVASVASAVSAVGAMAAGVVFGAPKKHNQSLSGWGDNGFCLDVKDEQFQKELDAAVVRENRKFSRHASLVASYLRRKNWSSVKGDYEDIGISVSVTWRGAVTTEIDGTTHFNGKRDCSRRTGVTVEPPPIIVDGLVSDAMHPYSLCIRRACEAASLPEHVADDLVQQARKYLDDRAASLAHSAYAQV